MKTNLIDNFTLEKLKKSFTVAVVLGVALSVSPLMSVFYFKSTTKKWIVYGTNYYFCCCFGILFLVLCYHSLKVIIRMNEQKIYSNMFKTEKRTVKVIMVIYNFSYLLRMVLEITVFPKLFSTEYDYGSFKSIILL